MPLLGVVVDEVVELWRALRRVEERMRRTRADLMAVLEAIMVMVVDELKGTRSFVWRIEVLMKSCC